MPSNIIQPCFPVDYIPQQNSRPNLLCKIFLPSCHLPFSLNNPILPPIFSQINNIVIIHKTFGAVGWFRNSYVYSVSTILFKCIIQRVSVLIHFMLLPTDRIRVITYLVIFLFHVLQHIICQSINHILICLQYICTLCIGMYQTNNIIVARIID